MVIYVFIQSCAICKCCSKACSYICNKPHQLIKLQPCCICAAKSADCFLQVP